MGVPPPTPSDLLHRIGPAAVDGEAFALHVRRMLARPAQTATWPSWVPSDLIAALARQGVATPWRHQVQAAQAVWEGTHTVVATGTASGKSLAYQLPVLATLSDDPRATALYLAPTKALAADQSRQLDDFGLDLAVGTLDGDTPIAERDWLRDHGQLILTNPDMLHHSVLPRHPRWARFFRQLRYVVVDECHVYRGVFGSHVAQVMRRLRRVSSHYGASPVFLLASATASDPARSAADLIGSPVRAFADNAAPSAGVTFVLARPPLLPAQRMASPSALRVSALRCVAGLLADLMIEGVGTLAFVRSRRGAEIATTMAREALVDAAVDDELSDAIATYRGGFLREERREIEDRLRRGELLAVATTNALELGINITGLDAVLLCGYPGTLASFWQQSGRAGRAGREALCILVARDDPLDTYLVHHPESIFDRPVEATVLDPLNPYVLGPHLCAAAAELPLTVADLAYFDSTQFGDGLPEHRTSGRNGPDIVAGVLAELEAQGALRRRSSGWYWTERRRPSVDLRGAGGTQVSVVEAETGRLLGTVDHGASHLQVHAGAVYLHQGATFVVEDLDLADSVALVRAASPDWTTQPQERTELRVISADRVLDAGSITWSWGGVEVTNQVVSYHRRRLASGEIFDQQPLDLPPRHLRTKAVWYTIAPEALSAIGVDPDDIPGALHAAEHAAIGLLPLVATCDRWDIGGLSTALHPDTSLPTVFVYDGHAGGAGFAERAFELAGTWLTATRQVIAECGCSVGCPACIQSPKCGNGNEPLAKSAAIKVLDAVIGALGAHRPASVGR